MFVMHIFFLHWGFEGEAGESSIKIQLRTELVASNTRGYYITRVTQLHKNAL